MRKPEFLYDWANDKTREIILLDNDIVVYKDNNHTYIALIIEVDAETTGYKYYKDLVLERIRKFLIDNYDDTRITNIELAPAIMIAKYTDDGHCLFKYREIA